MDSPYADATAAAAAARRRDSAPLVREAFGRELNRVLSNSRHVSGNGGASPGRTGGGGGGGAGSGQRRNPLMSTPRHISVQDELPSPGAAARAPSGGAAAAAAAAAVATATSPRF